MSPLLLVLLAALARGVQYAHVPSDYEVVRNIAFAEVTCGGLITVDSLSPNIPVAGLSSQHFPYYPVTDGRASASYVKFSLRQVSVRYAQLLEDTMFSSATNLLLFEIDATRVSERCQVAFDPTLGWIGGWEVSSLTAALFPLDTNSSLACDNISLAFPDFVGEVVLDRPPFSLSALQQSVRVLTINTRQLPGLQKVLPNVFPIMITAPHGCRAVIALAPTHYGRINVAAKWVPVLVYTIGYLPLALMAGWKRAERGSFLGLLLLFLTYLGYLGSCTGVAIEIASWVYPLHPFPFPAALTLFLSSAMAYAIALCLLLWRHPLGYTAVSSGLQMLLYGASVALMVGMFLRHLVLLGGLAIGFLVLVDIVMLIHSSRFSSRLPKLFREHAGSSRLLTFMMWCPLTAPVIPVTFLAIHSGWADMERQLKEVGSSQATERSKLQLQIVQLHSSMAAFLFLLFHNIPLLALAIAASIFHASFVIILIPQILLIILHVAHYMSFYDTILKTWGTSGLGLSLDRAIEFYLRAAAVNIPSSFAGVGGSPSVANTSQGRINDAFQLYTGSRSASVGSQRRQIA